MSEIADNVRAVAEYIEDGTYDLPIMAKTNLIEAADYIERLQAISEAFTRWIHWQESQGPLGRESLLEYDGEETEHQQPGWACWLCDYDAEQSAIVNSQSSPIDAITKAFAQIVGGNIGHA